MKIRCKKFLSPEIFSWFHISAKTKTSQKLFPDKIYNHD